MGNAAEVGDWDFERRGDGPPLVLLHGGLGTWHAWETVLPSLINDYEVFAPTLPGHLGGPPIPPGELSLGRVVDGLEAQLDAVGIDRAPIAGHSFGGWLAWELARRGRATGLVLLQPAGGWDDGVKQLGRTVSMATFMMRRFHWLLLPAMRSARFRRAFNRNIAVHGDRISADRARQSLISWRDCPIANEIAVLLAEHVQPDHSVTVPVLLAQTDVDRFIPRGTNTDRWKAAVPDADWRIVPGVGHAMWMDDPQGVADLVLEGAARANQAI